MPKPPIQAYECDPFDVETARCRETGERVLLVSAELDGNPCSMALTVPRAAWLLSRLQDGVAAFSWHDDDRPDHSEE